jgi:hypothetical protein
MKLGVSRRRGSFARCAILLGSVALAGCYSSATASFHPGDASQLVQQITRRGATVTQTVSGDPGCGDTSLTDNALHLTIKVPDDSVARDVYIFTFRSANFDASAAQTDACEAAYAQAHAGASVKRLDIAPYRAFGADWSPTLSATITAALTEASNLGT